MASRLPRYGEVQVYRLFCAVAT